MIKLPQSPRDWIIALIGALVGFFSGGAAMAAAEHLIKRLGGK